MMGLCACKGAKKANDKNNASTGNGQKNVKGTESESQAKVSKRTLNLYYFNHDDYIYISSVIDKLKSEMPDVTINSYYQSSDDYIEKLVKLNNTDSVADLYFLTENDIERAYLAGIMANNEDKKYSNASEYGIGAVNACTYKGKLKAYPLYFNTQVLVYNDNFGIHLPSSYEELKDMTSSFEAKEGMILEHILNWDISDMTINYSFVGAYLDTCGSNGDDSRSIQLNSDKAVNCAGYMRDLAAFFNINRENVTKDKVIESFAAGRSAFALINTDDLKKLNDAISAVEGEKIDYTIAKVPTIDNENYKNVRPLSETVMIAVNPFSNDTSLSATVAQAFSEYAKDMSYETVGKIPAKITDEIGGVPCNAAYDMYNASQPHIKLMNVGDFYTRLDIAFHNICDNADVKETLSGLQTYLSGNMK